MHSLKFQKQHKLSIPGVELRVYLAEGTDPTLNRPSTDDAIYECALVWQPPSGTGLAETMVHLDRAGRTLSRVEMAGLMFKIMKQIVAAHCREETAAAFAEEIENTPTWN